MGILLPASVDTVCAVCIPPGASLELQGISERLQRDMGVGLIERVTFTQIQEQYQGVRERGGGQERIKNGMEFAGLPLPAIRRLSEESV
jgi:hypothetical protein